MRDITMTQGVGSDYRSKKSLYKAKKSGHWTLPDLINVFEGDDAFVKWTRNEVNTKSWWPSFLIPLDYETLVCTPVVILDLLKAEAGARRVLRRNALFRRQYVARILERDFNHDFSETSKLLGLAPMTRRQFVEAKERSSAKDYRVSVTQRGAPIVDGGSVRVIRSYMLATGIRSSQKSRIREARAFFRSSIPQPLPRPAAPERRQA